jgi:FdhE protein
MEQKISAGVPLLVGESLEMNPEACRRIFLLINQSLCQTHPSNKQTLQLQQIYDRVKSGEIDPFELISAVECGDTGLLAETADPFNLDPLQLELLTQNTLKAFLRSWRRELVEHVDIDSWQRGICPFCGRPPALAEAQGTERARHLRCLSCGGDWLYQNLKCAFCGNEDYRDLGFIFVESEKHKYYAHTCRKCGRYIKTIITFEPNPPMLLMIEDLATLHLDQLAQERGFR